MTHKIFQIMELLSQFGVVQHGFTRNVELWELANQIDQCSIILTVEKGQPFPEYSKCRWYTYLIAEPNYKTQTVKIKKLGVKEVVSLGCGSGWVAQFVSNRKAPKVTVEDCSLCLKNNDGCYSILTKKKTT